MFCVDTSVFVVMLFLVRVAFIKGRVAIQD